MSLRYEQTRALKMTRDFMRDLLDPKKTKVPKEIRKAARDCLRHFPYLDYNGEPMFSQDGFPHPQSGGSGEKPDSG